MTSRASWPTETASVRGSMRRWRTRSRTRSDRADVDDSTSDTSSPEEVTWQEIVPEPQRVWEEPVAVICGEFRLPPPRPGQTLEVGTARRSLRPDDHDTGTTHRKTAIHARP